MKKNTNRIVMLDQVRLVEDLNQDMQWLVYKKEALARDIRRKNLELLSLDTAMDNLQWQLDDESAYLDRLKVAVAKEAEEGESNE